MLTNSVIFISNRDPAFYQSVLAFLPTNNDEIKKDNFVVRFITIFTVFVSSLLVGKIAKIENKKLSKNDDHD